MVHFDGVGLDDMKRAINTHFCFFCLYKSNKNFPFSILHVVSKYVIDSRGWQEHLVSMVSLLLDVYVIVNFILGCI